MGDAGAPSIISRGEPCGDCEHPKYDHDDYKCGQCSCTNTFTCSGCGHAWFHHHFNGCEGGLDCGCGVRPGG